MLTRILQLRLGELVASESEINAYCRGQGFVRTGVFASDGERRETQEIAAEVRNTPVVKVRGVWLPETAEEGLKKHVHSLALSHGLLDLAPDKDGDADYYGMIVGGEFVRLATPTKERSAK